MSVKAIKYSKRNGSAADGDVAGVEIHFKPADSSSSSSDDLTKPHSADDDREGWGNKVEFVLAIIGYAVGLGNVWRFPYLCHKNGGGAFLIPYFISLTFIGIPIFFLELSIGQRLRKGPLGVWTQISPYFSGLGLSAVIVSFLVGIYYNMIVAWCFYYLFISFAKTPPFAVCPTSNGTVVEECRKAGSTQYYWYRVTLEATDTIEEGGGLNWKLSLCLLLSWVVLFAIVFRGVQSVGKAVYFTALFPYLVLIIFFIRGITLEGAVTGIKHMFTPRFARLADPEVWLEASTQIFYSLGLAFGGLVAMASYNPINNNSLRDAIMVSTINCGTSIFASIVIFSVLGFKATKTYNQCLQRNENAKRAALTLMNLTTIAPATTSAVVSPNVTAVVANLTLETCDMKAILNNVAQGPGLTFIAFTEAITYMDVKPLWSILFFVMLLTLGIGSMIGTFECVRTTIVDLNIIPLRKEYIGAILCILSYLFGLLFCQRSGEYWLQMFDSYAGTVGLLIIGLFECILVVYVYGLKRFSNDIFYMLGKTPNIYWRANWAVIAPFLMIGILIASIYSLSTDTIGYEAWSSKEFKVKKDKPYPVWGQALCFILILCSAVWIPLVAVLRKFDLFRLKDEAVVDERKLQAKSEAVEEELHVHPGAVTPSMSRVPMVEFEESEEKVVDK